MGDGKDWIEVTEEEREDGEHIFYTLNSVMGAITSPLPMDFSAERAGQYYAGCMDVFKETKVMEHEWRVRMAKKYSVRYWFQMDNGRIR